MKIAKIPRVQAGATAVSRYQLDGDGKSVRIPMGMTPPAPPSPPRVS